MREEQFRAQFEKFSPLIYSKCLKILRNREDAQDAVQEVALRLAAHLDEFLAMENQVAWIYRVATNCSLNMLRTNKRKWDFKGAAEPDEVSVDGRQEGWANAQQELRRLLKPHKKAVQEAIVYHHVFGMTQAEIAEVMGKSRMTVSRWFRSFEKSLSEKTLKVSSHER